MRGRAWTCAGCSLTMLPGSVAIFAERAGQDRFYIFTILYSLRCHLPKKQRHRCWHPNCFRCSSCGDRLEDLLYFYSKGRLFCGRDFANLMKIPRWDFQKTTIIILLLLWIRCNACDELIFSTEYTGAEGGAYHLKHFCCWVIIIFFCLFVCS